MASFPATIKTFSTKVNNVDDVDASHINLLQEEVTAIETQLKTYYDRDATNGNRIGNIAGGNYVQVETDGTLVCKGTSTTYNDIYMSVAAAKVPTVGQPTWSSFTANTNAYTFALNDFADLSTIEIPHSYKEGTDLEVHVHFATNGLNNATERKVKYILYYVLSLQGTTITTEYNIVGEATIPANTIDKKGFNLSFGNISGVGVTAGSLLKSRIKRIASTGTEPINNPFVGMVGIHHETDTMGTRTMYVK